MDQKARNGRLARFDIQLRQPYPHFGYRNVWLLLENSVHLLLMGRQNMLLVTAHF